MPAASACRLNDPHQGLVFTLGSNLRMCGNRDKPDVTNALVDAYVLVVE